MAWLPGKTLASELAMGDPAASDIRSSSPVRAWGCRRVPIPHPERAEPLGATALAASMAARHGSGTTVYGRINAKSLRTPARLPMTAVTVDPVMRQPMRHCGGWTALPAYHQHQGYYLRFGNAGRNAATSQHHNFPGGAAPAPSALYTLDPCIGVNRCTKVRRPASAGPRPKVSRGVGTDA
jgi:hypothetical protein